MTSLEADTELKQEEQRTHDVEDRTNWPLGKIDPALWEKAETEELLNVIIYLGGTDVEKVIAEAKQAHLEPIEDYSRQLRQHQDKWRQAHVTDSLPEEKEIRVVKSLKATKPAEAEEIAEALDRALSSMRHSVNNSLRQAVNTDQEKIVRLVETNGGTLTVRIALVNAVAATIPSKALAEIATHPLVHTIVEDPPTEDSLDVSVPALNYIDWFNNGFDGGVWDFGIQEGVDVDHPALRGHDQCARPGSAASEHGTHVAGIAASTQAPYVGGAFGLDTIVWARTSVNVKQAVMMSDMEWMMSSDACDDPEVVNYSSGHSFPKDEPKADYVTNDSFYDAYVPTYNAMVTQAAGNNDWGPSCTMNRPACAYNILVVAAMNDKNTLSISDDVRRNSSSVGPTPRGRKKPDITAPGQGVMSCNIDWASASGFVSKSGTSMAAPHVAAAILLMQDGGITNDMAQKAVLINTADAWDSKGTQWRGDDGRVPGSHWDKSYGWGYLDMAEAFFNRNDYFLDSVVSRNDTATPDDYKLYKGFMLENEKATLVWRKRFSGYTSGSPQMTYRLSDINLRLFDEADGDLVHSDTSCIDNVHQVANNKGINIDAVIKVYSQYRIFGSATSEPYALATEENFKKADPPRFVLTTTAPAKVGALPRKPIFNVTLDVTNIGDVAAFNNLASLEIPLAFNLLSGTNPQPIGTIAAGETKTASWTLQARSWVGGYTFSFANSSYSYYETYTGSTSKSISVVIGTP